MQYGLSCSGGGTAAFRGNAGEDKLRSSDSQLRKGNNYQQHALELTPVRSPCAALPVGDLKEPHDIT